MRIAVVGAGSWGTAMCAHLASLGHEVRVWAREPEVVRGMNEERRNPFFLPDVELPAGVEAVEDMGEAMRGAEVVAMAVPSRWTREVARAARKRFPRGAAALNLAKGFDYRSDKRLSVAISEELGRGVGVAALSGPNHAEEVARQVPSATVISSADPALARRLQRVFSSPYFRVYTNSDIIGVEVGGAYKNIVAIVAGMLDGLGLGDNTKATLVTRGLAEMARFGAALGANPTTFSGLSGVGDLMVTCMSRHSRNRGFGESLGRGMTPREAGEGSRMVAEGVFAVESAMRLAHRAGVETPIAEGLKGVLEGRLGCREMLEGLMARELKDESEESLYRGFFSSPS